MTLRSRKRMRRLARRAGVRLGPGGCAYDVRRATTYGIPDTFLKAHA